MEPKTMSLGGRNKVSRVWQYMEKISPSEVACLLCNQRYAYHKSTSSLLRHIQVIHADADPPIEGNRVLEEEVRKRKKKPPTSVLNQIVLKASKVSESLESKSSVIKKHRPIIYDTERKRGFDKLILGMIVRDLQPFSIVEDQGFVKLLKGMEQRCIIPSKKHLVEVQLPRVYEETKDVVYDELQSATSISVSVEVWNHQKRQNFLSVCAHFLTSAWKSRSVMLDTLKLPEDYTATNLANDLFKVFEKWEIANKIFCITTDNSPEMAAAVGQLNINHQTCYAHRLSKAVQDALNSVQGLMFLKEKVMDIVTLFQTNAVASDSLLAMQRVQGKSSLRLKEHVEGQWLTIYDMFQRYVSLHGNVTMALKSLSKHDLIITDEDLESITECIKALEPFALAVMELSNDKLLTLSKVIPMTKTMKRFLNRSGTSGQLADELKDQMSQHFSSLEENTFTAAATYLDPRFREIAFEDVDTRSKVQEELKCMIEVDTTQPGGAHGDHLTIKKQLEASYSLWAEFDHQVQASRTSSATNVNSEADIEFGRYDGENLILRMENPLEWWMIKEKNFPGLGKLAKQFLSVSATSVPPESLFTKAGRLKCARRSSIKDTCVNYVLFLQQNCKDFSDEIQN